jgi:S-adenosylmethionine decarboxylase proenzyme
VRIFSLSEKAFNPIALKEIFAMEQTTTLGHHMLVEFYNCDNALLDNVDYIERVMNEAAQACGATIVQSTFHRFSPYGVSGVVVISESHLAIHTWPEFGYASIDLFTCGPVIDPMEAYTVLKEALAAKVTEVNTIRRGNLALIQSRMQNLVPETILAQKGGVVR